MKNNKIQGKIKHIKNSQINKAKITTVIAANGFTKREKPLAKPKKVAKVNHSQ